MANKDDAQVWEEFDKTVDQEQLAKDVQDAAENEYKEVPHGQYEVEVSKMELKKSKKGDPMLSIWFKVLTGEFKGSLIFYNQLVLQPFQIHLANGMLRSLAPNIDVEFNGSYKTYHDIILDVLEAVQGNYEFALDYGENNKGFNTYEITEVFELD